MLKYLKLWWIYTLRATQIAMSSRLGVLVFSIGKILRFGLYIFFIVILVSESKTLAGYSLAEVIFFFATFNLIDTSAQFFLRDVYRFRSHVVSGYFDTYLIKPISPLFKALFGGSDVLDLVIMFLSIGFILYSGQQIAPSLAGIIIYIFLLFNAFIIALSFHIFIVSLGILTTEVDNMLWMYRDLTQMGRIPVDIYHEPMRSIITFVIPIGIMMTFPVKALMGQLSFQWIVLACVVSTTFFLTSLVFWKYALRQYTSASS